MSRIGRMPIEIPHQVSVTVENNEIAIKGPKGELKRRINPEIGVFVEGSKLKVTRPSDDKSHKALHGLTRSLIANMVHGVTRGYEKGLEISGVGYRAEKDGQKLILRVGFTHPVVIEPRPGINFDIDAKNVNIKVIGIDKESVGQTAAEIRNVRPPDSYKGKGIRYAGEIIKLKAGKAGKAVGGKAK
jgi:large subunit ribosomal protein L6